MIAPSSIEWNPEGLPEGLCGTSATTPRTVWITHQWPTAPCGATRTSVGGCRIV